MTLIGQKPKYLDKTMSCCHFTHHRSDIDWPGMKLRPPRWTWAIPQQGYRVYKKTPGVLKELLMVFGLHMLLRLKYTTLDKIKQHSTPTENWYTHSAVKHILPGHHIWNCTLAQHSLHGLLLQNAQGWLANVYELWWEKVAQSVLQNVQPIPTAQEVTMYSWNTTEGIRIRLVACLIVRLSCVLS